MQLPRPAAYPVLGVGVQSSPQCLLMCSRPFVAVHPTTTKDSKVISLDTLADICAAVSIPVVAIGGMNAENCQPSLRAGCAGVAVVSAIFGAPDVAEAATAIREKVDCALGLL